jgi:hypothetical protein
VPSDQEWEAENLGSAQNAFTRLKLSATGYRFPDGRIGYPVVLALYWTSSFHTTRFTLSYSFTGSTATIDFSDRATGLPVRCIQN